MVDAKNTFNAKVVNAYDKVKAIEQEIKQHKDKNIPGEMEKLKQANEKLTERQKQIKAEKEQLAIKVDALKDEIAKQEVRILKVTTLSWYIKRSKENYEKMIIIVTSY